MDIYVEHLHYKKALKKSAYPGLALELYQYLLMIASGFQTTKLLHAGMVDLEPTTTVKEVLIVCEALHELGLIHYDAAIAKDEEGQLHGTVAWTGEGWKLIEQVKRITHRLVAKQLNRQDQLLELV